MRPLIIYSSLYLLEPVYEALGKIAFEERVKIHDVVLDGIDTRSDGEGIRLSRTLSTEGSESAG
jgi:hypothetical protein